MRSVCPKHGMSSTEETLNATSSLVIGFRRLIELVHLNDKFVTFCFPHNCHKRTTLNVVHMKDQSISTFLVNLI